MKLLKVGFIVLNPLSLGLGYSLRPAKLIEYLLKEGIEVHVFTPFNEIPESLIKAKFHLNSSIKIAFLQNISYKSMRFLSKNKFTATNFLYKQKTLELMMNNLKKSIISSIIKHKINIVQAEQDIPAAVATSLKYKLGIPVVADIHDLWAEEETLTGRVESESNTYFTLNRITSQAVAESDANLVGNYLVRDYLTSKFHVQKNKIHILPNGGEILDFPETCRVDQIIYAGNFEKYEYVDLFIESITYILEEFPDMEISIAGRGPEESHLKSLAKGYGIPLSIFKGYIERSKLLRLFMKSKVGVVPTKKTYATPIKPFDYMSAGLPVVAIRDTWWGKIIEENGAGLTSSFDPKEFAQSIVRLCTSSTPGVYNENAKRLIREKYNWMKITRDLIEIYKQLLK